jgi:hypothetical protein
VTNRLFLIRNPWGSSSYTGNWSTTDYTNWTPSNKRQANFANNTINGLFFVEDKDFVQAFQSFTINYYSESFVNNYLEVLNDNGSANYYSFTLATTGYVYLSVDFYTARMYPLSCRGPLDQSNGLLSLQTLSGATV